MAIRIVKGEPRWVPVGVAALLLGISPRSVTQLAVKKVIKRALRQITHMQTRPCWMYSIEDIAKVRRAQGGTRTWHPDVTGKYVSSNDAARMLQCSDTSIHNYAKMGMINIKKSVQFQYPKPKVVRGYWLADILSMRSKQAAVCTRSSFEEETVIDQTSQIERKKKYAKVTDPHQRAAISTLISNLQDTL